MTTPDTDKHKNSLEETIIEEKVKALYLALPSSLVATVFVAAALIFILWQEIDTTRLIIWFAVIVIVSFARFFSYLSYVSYKKKSKSVYFWDRLFYFLLVLAAMAWSCVSIWLLPDNESLYHYIPALILIGISAAAVTSLGVNMRNFVTYFSFLLVPLFISEMIVATFLSYTVAFLTVVFYILALSNTKRIGSSMQDNIRLRYLAEKYKEDLIESRNIAIEANSAKSKFIAMISHELRTPLNGVLGFAQLMKMSSKPSLSEEQNEYVDGLTESGGHLLSLIEELIDLSNIDANKLNISIVDVSLADALNESLVILNPLASERNIEIINNIENNYVVKADSKRLKQVFINIISNAIKYNHEHGQVIIDVSQVEGGKIKISILDTGSGLSAEQQEHLFEAFTRFQHSKEGLGLGMFITQNLIGLMDGKIGVESTTEKGSKFWFELPLSTTPESIFSSAKKEENTKIVKQ